MFRLLRTAATATARWSWRLPEATTALNHTMQTSSYCSQPKSTPFSQGHTLPSTLQESQQKWPLWELEDAAIPHVIFRDAAKDVLETSLFRLQNNMIRSCLRNNIFIQDLIYGVMAAHTPDECINATRIAMQSIFSSCPRGVNKETYEHFMNMVNAMKTRRDVQDIVNHVMVKSLEQRTMSICGGTQRFKNFTRTNFQDKMHGRRSCGWKTAYNNYVMNHAPDRLVTPFDPNVIGDPKIKKAVTLLYNRMHPDNTCDRDRYDSNGRAGLLLLFRNTFEHIREYAAVNDQIDRQELMVSMHTGLGGVNLDLFDVSLNHQLKKNLTIDHLDVARDYGQI